MYYVYILYSFIKKKYYVGCTSNLEERIIKHNSNHKGFTGNQSDWVLKYREVCDSKEQALEREKEIKKWKSKIMIERLISSLGSEHPDL